MKKLISIVTPVYNESENILELYQRILSVMKNLEYDYEHIIIDNSSTDNSPEILRKIAEDDLKVKVIFNTRNFGYIKSSIHAIFQANGDAVIHMASDLQDPPELIPKFIEQWEKGYKSVMAIKPESEEGYLMKKLRNFYYRVLYSLSEVPLVNNATGAGLYDKKIIDIIKGFEDPYPYFRGLIPDVGYPIAKVVFKQPKRKRGITSTNFYSLYDFAMLGFINHSKVPLRMASFLGFGLSFVSIFLGVIYLIYKLIFWSSFSLGIAPLVLGIFFIGGVQLLFLGIVGEYIGAIYTHVRKRPYIIERERINW